MLNPRTVNEALDIVYNQLSEFEYILIQGNGLFGYEPKVLSIAIGYWNSRIVVHLTDENLVTLASCDIDNVTLIQYQITKIIKCYKIDIKSIAFINNSTTKEIAEFAFHHNKQVFKTVSTKTGEQTVSVSYHIEGRMSDDKLIQLSKSYDNLLDSIYEDADMQVVKLKPDPITLIRKRKLKKIGVD